MSAHRVRGIALACATAVAALARTAGAQPSAATTRWALDRYEPPPAGDPFMLAEHPWYDPAWRLAAGLVVQGAENLLTLHRTLPGGRMETTSVVASGLTGYVRAAAAFAGGIAFNLSLPVSIVQQGTGVETLGPAGSPAVGDLRIGGRARVLWHAEADSFSLHAGFDLWLPTGSREANLSDGTARFAPRLVAAGTVRWLRWSTSAGVMLRPARDVGSAALGSELRVTAGLAAVLLQGRFSFGPEASFATVLRSTSDTSGLELMGSAHYLAGTTVLFGLGAGGGIGPGPGTPAFRGVASITYAPR